MTRVASNSLPVSTSDEDCASLGGVLYAAVVHAAGYAIFFLSLAWLVQTTLSAAPGAVWWKSAIALALVLAGTWFLRMARRFDPHATQGWTLFDAALLLAGGLVTTIFVLRSGPLAGALFIGVFITLEGLSLWRLRLLPEQIMSKLGSLTFAHSPPIPGPTSLAPLHTHLDEEIAVAALETSGDVDSAVSQQFTRRETQHVVEITGFVRGEFAQNELASSVDISFCPTLAGQPTLEFDVLCEEELEVRIATVRAYGARLELKRKGTIEGKLAYTLEVRVACQLHSATTEPTRELADN